MQTLSEQLFPHGYSLLLPLGFPIPVLLCLGFSHEPAVFRAPIPATTFVIHASFQVNPDLTGCFRSGDVRIRNGSFRGTRGRGSHLSVGRSSLQTAQKWRDAENQKQGETELHFLSLVAWQVPS